MRLRCACDLHRRSRDAELGPVGWLLGFLLDRAPLPSAITARRWATSGAAGTLPAGPTRYNVYREIDPGNLIRNRMLKRPPPVADAGDACEFDAPRGLQLHRPQQIDSRRRCYAVSAVRGDTRERGRGSSIEVHVRDTGRRLPARPAHWRIAHCRRGRDQPRVGGEQRARSPGVSACCAAKREARC